MQFTARGVRQQMLMALREAGYRILYVQLTAKVTLK